MEKRTKKLKVECTVKGTTTGKEAKWTDGSDLEVTIERALLEESTLDRDALVSSVLSSGEIRVAGTIKQKAGIPIPCVVQ